MAGPPTHDLEEVSMALALRIEAQAQHLPDSAVGTVSSMPFVGYYDDVPEYANLRGFWKILGFNLWCLWILVVSGALYALFKTGIFDLVIRLSTRGSHGAVQ